MHGYRHEKGRGDIGIKGTYPKLVPDHTTVNGGNMRATECTMFMLINARSLISTRNFVF